MIMRELDLLQHVYAFNRDLPGHVSIAPGDDMGAIRLGDEELLVTVDQVIDGVHVDRATTSLELIGRKAITRNLSDVAAMAGTPLGAVVAVCLPGDFTEVDAKILFDAMRQTADDYDCPLIGGDISTSKKSPLAITVTVFAKAHCSRGAVLRSGAKVGDLVCVSGQLGGAWQVIDPQNTENFSPGGGGAPDSPPAWHLVFVPRIKLAQQLAARLGAHLHSMIDLSDGLASDLTRICERSNVNAQIDVDQLPVRTATHIAVCADGVPAWRHALNDGEDYELCFTIDPTVRELLHELSTESVPLTVIGHITKTEEFRQGGQARVDEREACITLQWSDGRSERMTPGGWEHTT